MKYPRQTSDQKSGMQPAFSLSDRLNHLLFAVLFLALMGAGFMLAYGGLDRETRSLVMGYHKAVGFLMIAFACWRVGRRLYRGFPPPIASLKGWQETAARHTHKLLLVGAILMPVSGFLGSVFGGRAVNVFGLFTVPAITDNEILDTIVDGIHTGTAYVMAVMLSLHIAAAFKHHFIDKDATLRRMLTGKE